MDELRFVRREEGTLIFESDAGASYRVQADETVLSEVRLAVRAQVSHPRVNPREIQSMIRSGKSHQEIMAATGADESDIERYEAPVVAERKFILTTASKIPVRTHATEQSEQQFGAVIAERLIGLSAINVQWDSWRDDEAGWMIKLEFDSNGTEHRAIWSFDHRKGVLSPLTPDAVNLSKQGEVGDRLLPKLRAVDNLHSAERFDSGSFHRVEDLEPDTSAHHDESSALGAPDHSVSEEHPPPVSLAAEAALKAGHPSTGAIPVITADTEFARRREIEERAISTSEPEPQDLGQTADLLDALRRRRGQRQNESQETDHEVTLREFEAPVSLHPEPIEESSQIDLGNEVAPADRVWRKPQTPDSGVMDTDRAEPELTKRGKGRTSIPSWDDILFGTRGESEDHTP